MLSSIIKTFFLSSLIIFIYFLGETLDARGVLNTNEISMIINLVVIVIIVFIWHIWSSYLSMVREKMDYHERLKSNARIATIMLCISIALLSLNNLLLKQNTNFIKTISNVIFLVLNNYVQGFLIIFFIHTWLVLFSLIKENKNWFLSYILLY